MADWAVGVERLECGALMASGIHDDASCRGGSGSMKSKLEQIKLLSAKIKDAYPDFIIAVPAFAKSDGTIDEVLEYLWDNPDARTDEVLEYMDSVADRPEIMIEGIDF